MHRAEVLNLLKRYNPNEADEIKFKNDMISFIESNADCFQRTNTNGHITSSAWILNFERNKALLTHHAKLNDWFQLGGHCDGDHDVLAVALKEAREESGIDAMEPIVTSIFDIDIHLIPENIKDPAHYHYDIRFLLQTKSNQSLKVNHESKGLLWVAQDWNSLPTKKRSVTRMFNKWLNIYPQD